MKLIKTLGAALVSGLILFTISCNSGTDKKTEEAVLKSDTTKKDVSPVKPADLMIIKHHVADFDKWQAAFDADDSARKIYGLHNYGVSKGIDDPKMVLVTLLVDDLNRAKEFASLPKLKATMKAAGVTDEPVILYFDRQSIDLSTSNITNRVIVSHKVKDWDAWKKAFDSHKQARSDAGILDRAVGFEAGNKNNAIVVAVVNDVKKAKEFFGSKDLKDNMQAAGVEGEPSVFFFSLVKKF